MGYRRIRDELDGHKGIHVNDKRVLRICRKYDIKSNIKWKPKSCTRGDRNPDHIAKNYLHREFHAEKPNEKWLTDVSEFKYYNGIEVHKVYLSAILDLYDRRIVSFKISDHNDNPLVMDTFDKAVRQEPDAHPLVHSDRGFQYTSAQFYTRLKKHHMKRLRKGKCTIGLGLVLSDLAMNYERVADHCSNIAVYMMQLNDTGLEEHSFTEQMDEKESAEFTKLENEFEQKYEID